MNPYPPGIETNPRELLPITVVIAAKNERVNIAKCLASTRPARRVIVVDSGSTDGTVEEARRAGAEVVQFSLQGAYPKKRQWALDTLGIETDWTFLLDADEEIPEPLWWEAKTVMCKPQACAGYLVRKEFHFLETRMRFGGFSHEALVMFRSGRGRFEHLLSENAGGFDMEVHERIIVDGRIGRLRTPLVHNDWKGLEAYIERHERYSTWEATLRAHFIRTGSWGINTIRAKLSGNSQERRRFAKAIAVRLPFEPTMWFLYHYILRLGFLEGWRGLLASRIRRDYIRMVRAKVRLLLREPPG